ncbi:MAG: serine hydrolase domain-containing protein [Planctomycetaceae bacterium]
MVLLLLLCGAIVPQSPADDFPLSVSSVRAERMPKLVQEAVDRDLLVTGLKARTIRSRSVFDVTFAANSEKLAWIILINQTAAQQESSAEGYAKDGYEVSLQETVRSGSQKLVSTVWVRRTEKSQLILPEGEVPVSGAAVAGFEAADEFMTAFLKKHNAAGATLAISDHGRIVYNRGFGYADVTAAEAMQPNHVMRIASISKPLTAVAVMLLCEQGKLDPDQPVLPLLASAVVDPPTDSRWKDMTIRHLLQHSAGWDRAVSGDPMFRVVEITREEKLRSPARQTDIVRWQLQRPLDFDPGSKYAYSNFGYCVLGRVIEVVTQKSCESAVRELVLDPCGMQTTRLGKTRLTDRQPDEVRYHMQTATRHTPFWKIAQVGNGRRSVESIPAVESPYGQWDLEVMDAHGGWLSSSEDLLKLLSAMDRSDQPLLKTASLETMLARPTFEPENEVTWYGLGWSVRNKGGHGQPLEGHNIWHTGALAGTSTLLVHRFDGMAWAVLFNTDFSTTGKRLTEIIDPQLHSVVSRCTKDAQP